MAKKEGQTKRRRQSGIMAFFTKISGAVYDKAKNSFIGSVLCGYDTLNDRTENGVIKTLVSKLKLGRRVFRPIKRVTSKIFSQSILLLKLKMFLWSFLSTRMNVYGLFFMTSGIGSLLVAFMKRYVLAKSELSFLDCFVSSLLIISSIPLLFSNVCMSEAIRKSRFLSGFLFEFLGISKVPFERKLKPTSHNNTAWLFGILFCALSYVYRPHQILLFIVFILYLTASLFSPETSVVCLALVLPFLPQAYLLRAVLFTALCWFLKYIRGKRTFKTDMLSSCVLIFGFIVLFTCMVSGDIELSLKPTLTFLCAVLGFFLVENLIKSKEWLYRCMKAMLASYFIVCFVGVLGLLLHYFDNSFVRSIMSASDGNNIFAFLLELDVRAEYIVMILPAAFSLMITSRKNKFNVFLGIMLGFVCLFSAYTYGAWIGAFAGLLLFFLVGGKRILAAVFLSVCFIPFAILLISPSYIAGITNFNLFADRVSNWVGNISNSFSVFTDFILGGSGVGTYERISALSSLGNSEHSLYLRLGIELGIIGILMFFAVCFFALQKNITAYSKSCSDDVRLISLSNLSGLVSLLVMGIGGNVWSDFNVCLLFWLMLGMSSAAVNIEKSNYSEEDLLLGSDT